MRVLFTHLPGMGSLQPLRPVAEALIAAGHEVAFAAAGPCRDLVEDQGLPFFAAGLGWNTAAPDYIDVLCAAGGLTWPALTGMARLDWVTEHLFIGVAARRMLPDVIRIAGAWRADLIIRQSLEFSGCVAAEALGLPHVSVADAAHSAIDQRRALAEPLAALRASVGLAADADMLYRHLHLCFAPREFDPPDATVPDTARFYRYTETTLVDPVPPWADELGARPLVLVSLGTVFHRTEGLLQAILAGLAREPVDVLVAAGFDLDPTRFGPLRPGIRAEPQLPIRALLPRCAAFVTHGGFNSVKESVAAGVPMVVIPIAAEQPYSAERCAALGLGVAVGREAWTPEAVRAAVRTVLADPAYRRRCAAMRARMLALPDMSHAVAELEALAARRAPASVPGMCPVAG